MLNSLSALKARAKKQIEKARSQLPSQNERLAQIDSSSPMSFVAIENPDDLRTDKIRQKRLEEEEKKKDEELRQKRLKELEEADKILPAMADDDFEIAKKVNAQYSDSWARIISEFKRQIANTNDLRSPMADPSVYIEHPTDHPTVKFFKGVFNEWRERLYELDNEELEKRKNELTIMWYCLFSLQPFFEGLNTHDLGRDISVCTEGIVTELKKLNFKKAVDHYNRMAIGTNLWPIGITQYSIHWKFSADLIDSDRMLHLFNNEPARNAILSIKRLMSKYEEFHKNKTK
ncbi:Pre-mRNA-splicing factor 18 [Tritrichomonas musculus]|uniref:Pre-mRNA-splicing factor 18 n=1 Tax=Tritrichomonas musculus TaxID=1915356 RepID=A0ABR2KXJ3_9EUKA